MTTTAPCDRSVRVLAALIAAVLALGVASSLIPVVRMAVPAVLVGAAGLAALAVLTQMLARRARHRREDQEDALIAARWCAEHTGDLRLVTSGVA